jgi:hypothetical protein
MLELPIYLYVVGLYLIVNRLNTTVISTADLDCRNEAGRTAKDFPAEQKLINQICQLRKSQRTGLVVFGSLKSHCFWFEYESHSDPILS